MTHGAIETARREDTQTMPRKERKPCRKAVATNEGTGKMTSHCLRAFAILAGDPGRVSNTHVRQLTTTYDLIFPGSNALFCPLWLPAHM